MAMRTMRVCGLWGWVVTLGGMGCSGSAPEPQPALVPGEGTVAAPGVGVRPAAGLVPGVGVAPAAPIPFDLASGLFGPPRTTPSVPLSGGTLLVTQQDGFAVAADPDRDQVYVVDVAQRTLLHTIVMPAGSEPGRLAEDDRGGVHVANRAGGTLVSFDPRTGTIAATRQVCPAPRGVAFDAATAELHVACQTGELVSFALDALEPARTLQLDRDLRDIVVDGSRLLVSRFKTAEVLVVEGGSVTARLTLPPQMRPVTNVVLEGVPSEARTTGLDGEVVSALAPSFDAFGNVQSQFSAAVAWRMMRKPDGGVVMTHAEGNDGMIPLGQSGGYGGFGCQGDIMRGRVAEVDVDGGGMRSMRPLPGLLHTDIAFNANDGFAAVAAASSWGTGFSNSIILGRLDDQPEASDPFNCISTGIYLPNYQPTSIAFSGDQVLVLSREPAALVVIDTLTREELGAITLDSESRFDTGYSFFHADSGLGIACASCHPEGQEDGRAWNFEGLGLRRSQAMGGGILSTVPLHWDGEFSTFDALVEEVMVRRMGFGLPPPDRIAALAAWLDTLPAAAGRDVDPEAVTRGQAAFVTAQCNQCHVGPHLTDNLAHDVGTGGAFQTPTLLGIGARAPFIHTGCAETLMDRFDPACGGANHGLVATLSEAELQDLVMYLEAL